MQSEFSIVKIEVPNALFEMDFGNYLPMDKIKKVSLKFYKSIHLVLYYEYFVFIN